MDKTEIILQSIKTTNPENVTQRQLDTLRSIIENAVRNVNRLQAVHRSLTGRNHVLPIRLT